MSEADMRNLIDGMGGTVEEVGRLPDGSGFAVASLLPPEGHWLTADPDVFNVPPMPMRTGTDDPRRAGLERALTAAGRYAVRSATDCGKIIDFDPDALVQNLIVGVLGYHTADGLSSDGFANPPTDH